MAKKGKKPVSNGHRQQTFKKAGDQTIAKKKPRKGDRPGSNPKGSGWRETAVRKTTSNGHGYVLYTVGPHSGRMVFDPIQMEVAGPPGSVKPKKQRRKRD